MLGLHHRNGSTNILPINLSSCPTQIHIFLIRKNIFTPSKHPLKFLAHCNINSKPKVSFKHNLNQVWVSLKAKLRQNSFFNIFICIYLLYRGFHCDISIYAYNAPWLGSSPSSFSLIPLPST
jgi:hypothetical protein